MLKRKWIIRYIIGVVAIYLVYLNVSLSLMIHQEKQAQSDLSSYNDTVLMIDRIFIPNTQFEMATDAVATLGNQYVDVTQFFYVGNEGATGGIAYKLYAVDNNPFDVGIPVPDSRYYETFSQQVDLLYGSYWTTDTIANVIIIDETVANAYFSRTDVVGEEITYNGKYFKIVGVYEDTIYRDIAVDVCKTQNPEDLWPVKCITKVMPSMAFIPYGTYESMVANDDSLNYFRLKYVQVSSSVEIVDTDIELVSDVYNVDLKTTELFTSAVPMTLEDIHDELVLYSRNYILQLVVLSILLMVLTVGLFFVARKRHLGMSNGQVFYTIKERYTYSVIISLTLLTFVIISANLILGIIRLVHNYDVFNGLDMTYILYCGVFVFISYFGTTFIYDYLVKKLIEKH